MGPQRLTMCHYITKIAQLKGWDFEYNSIYSVLLLFTEYFMHALI